ncbi:MAG: methyltransferase domain-containing protein [Ferruginibacter sp.]
MNHQPPVLDASYWNDRYAGNETGWDMKQVSPPLKAYADQLTDKALRILIPGCGNSYEAEYLSQQGFSNITLIDIAPLLVTQLRERLKDHAGINIILGDFFEHAGAYDLVLEQTFFCALDPSLREAYAKKMHALLTANGRLAGVLFNKQFEDAGPPFGGSMQEYESLFSPSFHLHTLSGCYNSHPKRAGAEAFIIAIKQ